MTPESSDQRRSVLQFCVLTMLGLLVFATIFDVRRSASDQRRTCADFANDTLDRVPARCLRFFVDVPDASLP